MTRHIQILTVAVAALLMPALACAQLELDPHLVVETLAEEGMADLLEHYKTTAPPNDGTLPLHIEAVQLRLRFASTDAPADERAQALAQSLDITRSLIEDFPDHPHRPIWQTTLGEMLLVEHLQVIHQNAPQFYAFGVPTLAQEQAFEEAVPEALAALRDADQRLAVLRQELAGGQMLPALMTRLFDVYHDRRTRFYLASAELLAAMLPDEPPPLAAAPNAEQGASATHQRQQLLAQVVERLAPLLEEAADAADIRQPVLLLQGRAYARLGEVDNALRLLNPLIERDTQTLDQLEAALAKARALREQGQFAAALESLDRLRHHTLLRSNLLYRLLLTDAIHLTRLAEAQAAPPDDRAAAIAAAYQPYRALLDDPSLAEHAASLEAHVYQRWASSVDAEQDLTDLPPLVRLAAAQAALVEGQQLATQALENEADELPGEAQRQFRRAIAAADTLRDPKLPDHIRAAAAYHRILAQYWLDRQDTANLLAVAQQLTALAQQFPEQSQAEQAIANAVALLRPLHQSHGALPEIQQAYRDAAQVLFTVFPTTAAADNERLYYGSAILEAQGRHADAAALYAQMPFSHPDYFESRRRALLAMLSDAAGGAASADRQGVVRAAEQLRREAQSPGQPDDADRAASARRASATATLALADIALATGDTDRAVELLSDLEAAHQDEPDLMREGLERRVLALVQSGRLNEASAEAARLMRDYPTQGASVINEVLSDLQRQMDDLRIRIATHISEHGREELRQQRQNLAEVAVHLSALLIDWANGQNLPPQQMLPFQLVRSRALRLTEQTQAAADLVLPLLDRFSNQAGLLHEAAEVLFALGGERNLVQAAALYDRIITGFGPPYPDMWWNAWARRLQINDVLGEATNDIPLRIRQLRLTDPDLGGPPHRQTLEELEARYGQQQ